MSKIEDASREGYSGIKSGASEVKEIYKKGSKASKGMVKGFGKVGKKAGKGIGKRLVQALKSGFKTLGRVLLITGIIGFSLILGEGYLTELEYETKPRLKMYTDDYSNTVREDVISSDIDVTSEGSSASSGVRSLLRSSTSTNGNLDVSSSTSKDYKVVLSEKNQAVENYHYYNSTKSMLENKYYIPLEGIDVDKNPSELINELLKKDAIEFEGEYKFIRENSLEELEKNWIEGYGVDKKNFKWTTDISDINKKINQAGSLKGFKSKYVGELTKIEDEKLKVEIKDPYAREEFFKVPEELLSRFNNIIYEGKYYYDKPFLNPVKFKYVQGNGKLVENEGGDTDSDSTSNGDATVTSTNDFIIVGDSRVEGMDGIIDTSKVGSVELIYKRGEGFKWFNNTGIKELTTYMNSNKNKTFNVVFALGVNDYHNVKKYISKYNELVNGYLKSHNVYFMSVNPVDEDITKKHPTYKVHSNAKIEEFNSEMKKGLDSKIKYIDCYSYLIKEKFTAGDGLHYDTNTTKKIFNYIVESVNSMSGNARAVVKTKNKVENTQTKENNTSKVESKVRTFVQENTEMKARTSVSNNESMIDTLLDLVRKQLGKPYVWGAEGPNSFDCSGLTEYCFKNALNISLPRTSAAQSKVGTEIKSLDDVKPGDLVFFNTNGKGVSHVGIIESGYTMIHSPSTGKNVMEVDLSKSDYYKTRFVVARRLIESNKPVASITGGTIEDLQATLIETKKNFRAIPASKVYIDTQGLKEDNNRLRYGLGTSFIYKPVIEFELERGVRITQTAVKQGDGEEGNENIESWYEPVVTAEVINEASAKVMYALDAVVTFNGVYRFEYDLDIEEVSSTDTAEEGEPIFEREDGSTFGEVKSEQVKKVSFKEKPSGVYLESEDKQYIQEYLYNFQASIPENIYKHFDINKLVNAFKGDKNKLEGSNSSTNGGSGVNGENSSDVERTEQWRELAVIYGEKYGIDPNLILALIYNESKGDVHIKQKNPDSYRGLSQMGGPPKADNDHDVYNYFDKATAGLHADPSKDSRFPQCPSGSHPEELHNKVAEFHIEYVAKRLSASIGLALYKYKGKDYRESNVEITEEDLRHAIFWAFGSYNTGEGGQNLILKQQAKGNFDYLYSQEGAVYKNCHKAARQKNGKPLSSTAEYIEKLYDDYPLFADGASIETSASTGLYDKSKWEEHKQLGGKVESSDATGSITTGTNGKGMSIENIKAYESYENMENLAYKGTNTLVKKVYADQIEMMLDGAIAMMYSQSLEESAISKDAYWKDGFLEKYFRDGVPIMSPPGYYMEDGNWKFKIVESYYNGNTNSILELAERYGSSLYDVIKTAVNQIGRNYKVGGAVFEFDSASLIWHIYNFHKNKPYFEKKTIEEYHEEFTTTVDENDIRPGDISFFVTENSTENKADEAIVYLGNDAALHASAEAGQVVMIQYSAFKKEESRKYVDTRRILKFDAGGNASADTESESTILGDMPSFEGIYESNDIEHLHPYVKALAKKFLDACEKENFSVKIYVTYRSIEKQNDLYAQGRTKPGSIVTKAKGGYSYHNYGLAFDAAPVKANGQIDWDDKASFKRMGAIGKSVGLEWGGDWKSFVDMPHFQWTGGLKIKDLLQGKMPAIPN